MDIAQLGGTFFSAASTSLKIDVMPVFGFLGFDWEESRERALVWAALRNQVPVGQTRGKYVPGKCTLKVHAASANTILTYLSGKGLGSYGSPTTEFIINITAFEEPTLGGGALPQNVTAIGCFIESQKRSIDWGSTDALSVEFTIQARQYLVNGLALADRLPL